MTVVTDSGPLIVLAKISHLHLLPILYTEVIIPPAVYHEVVVVGQTRGYADAEALQAFFDSRGWQPSEPPRMPPELTGEVRLGKGEREAITLAQQHQSLLLVDEVYARSVAARMGIETVLHCPTSCRWCATGEALDLPHPAGECAGCDWSSSGESADRVSEYLPKASKSGIISSTEH